MNVLITGASKGIGFELVQKFAHNKQNRVVALARDMEQLKTLQSICKKKYNNTIEVYALDFLSENIAQQIVDLLTTLNCHFDMVVNNAGCLINKPFATTSAKDVFKTFQTNVFAPILLIQQIIPLLNETKWSHIVNIGSMGGYQGSVKFPGLSIYSASKAALASLTECLAEEYKDRKVSINCLALGAVQTEMLSKAFPGFQAQVSAQQMAEYIYNFSIQNFYYITGKVIPVARLTP